MHIPMTDDAEEALVMDKVRKYFKYKYKILRRREALGDLRWRVPKPPYVTIYRVMKMHYRTCRSRRCLSCKNVVGFEDKLAMFEKEDTEDEQLMNAQFACIS